MIKSGRAWWSGDLGSLRRSDPLAILGDLSVRLVESHPLNRATQIDAWRAQIDILLRHLAGLPDGWRVLLEYPVLRLGRRIDTVLLTDRAIIVLEFKVGATSFSNQDRQQVEDYALDLFDFHAGSRTHPVIPVLVATQAPEPITNWPLCWFGVTSVLDANGGGLADLLRDVARRIPEPRQPLDQTAWEAAPYRPVPTIVEAAQMLYGRHGVDDIASARADVGNLTRTTLAITSATEAARQTGSHHVVLVTGIPGAGKTLCGLNAVFGTNAGAAFLTGNLPLVHVLREALAQDASKQGRSLRAARQETEGAIQPLIGFLRDNLDRSDPPHEHVIVFDEAQRAWDAKFGHRKFGHAESEAGMFLDIMNRHPDWAVIVALVGNGQEINTGEAGLQAWGEALQTRPSWSLSAPPSVLGGPDVRQRLFDIAPPQLILDAALHLDVPVRSIRSAAAAPWVDAVLHGDTERARDISDAAHGVPFQVTRSLAAMRLALRRTARGTRRAGLICSAGARRLRADGISPDFPHMDADVVANWFLRHWPDVRASDALEQPATQFACQGLELDHVGLCWGNDLIRTRGQAAWAARRFIGSRWQTLQGEAKVAYQTNTCRVLLTRARYETVIWVPEGDAADATRDPAHFAAVADFLLACGATPLDETPVATDAAVATLLL